MKKRLVVAGLVITLALTSFMGCGKKAETPKEPEKQEQAKDDSKVASSGEMTTVEEVVEEGMTPIYGKDIKDGTYDIEVKSSSSMFNIVSCELTVANGEMTAVMTMHGTGYKYVFMGTGEEAVEAEESAYIPYVENAEGAHTFTVPVEALDASIPCTAFSAKKEKWYDRNLCFKASSLPADAYKEGIIVSCSDLALADGTYTVDVTLTGGSGRASVESPAKITVANGEAIATIVWSSKNYDYMLVNNEKYLPVNTEGNSVFEIPVTGFDYEMPVVADTTAMSEPHEISYTLNFDSTSIK